MNVEDSLQRNSVTEMQTSSSGRFSEDATAHAAPLMVWELKQIERATNAITLTESPVRLLVDAAGEVDPIVRDLDGRPFFDIATVVPFFCTMSPTWMNA